MMSEESFFGIEKTTEPRLNGNIIELSGAVLTKEIFDKALEEMTTRMNNHLAPCQDLEGNFHHWPYKMWPNICSLCGWNI
jgi:hypothetical protein